MKKKNIIYAILLSTFVLINPIVQACTNFLITKGASADGSTMISYAADSHVLYGELYHWPAAKHKKGSMLDIYEWDTGKFLGKIPQVKETYNVVGNINEYQVAIGETTYGGRKELGSQEGAIMDYGSLIYVALQRSKSAREAIKIITELMAEHGYYSVGESFSISDKDEVWILELIGKGDGHKGAVWVALKIPDGYISAHANQARIQTFPQKKKDGGISFDKIKDIYDKDVTCVYSDDVVSFAKDKGWYDGKDKDFSFSDTYAPVGFGGARFCEARVWSIFRQVNDDMEQYTDYALGHNLKNRMPLWIKPNRKISLNDMKSFMRDHFEGTPLDMAKDIGAGPFQVPYRWRPLTWKVDDVTYCNERAVATQQTGFSFITQSRNWMPDPIGGVIWFAVDDAASSVYAPMYCGITKIPKAFAQGNGSIMEYTRDAAFWVFNEVSNFTYTRYNIIHPDVETKQKELEDSFISRLHKSDKVAMNKYNSKKKEGIEHITNFSVNIGNELLKEWKELYAFLFAKFMDGNIKAANKVPENHKYVNPDLEQPGYSKDWYKKVVKKTGDKFKMSNGGH